MEKKRGLFAKNRSDRAGSSGAILLLALLLAATGIVGGLIASPKAAYACSCAFDRGGTQSIDFADAIFSGTVVGRTPSLPSMIGSGSGADPVDYAFETEQAWKGKVYKKTTVTTAAGTESCGADFREGSRYIVLAKRDGAKLTTSLCSGSVLYEAGGQPDILKLLGEPAQPLAGASPGARLRSYLWAAVAAAAAIASVVAWFAVRRRRARRRPQG